MNEFLWIIGVIVLLFLAFGTGFLVASDVFKMDAFVQDAKEPRFYLLRHPKEDLYWSRWRTSGRWDELEFARVYAEPLFDPDEGEWVEYVRRGN